MMLFKTISFHCNKRLLGHLFWRTNNHFFVFRFSPESRNNLSRAQCAAQICNISRVQSSILILDFSPPSSYYISVLLPHTIFHYFFLILYLSTSSSYYISVLLPHTIFQYFFLLTRFQSSFLWLDFSPPSSH